MGGGLFKYTSPLATCHALLQLLLWRQRLESDASAESAFEKKKRKCFLWYFVRNRTLLWVVKGQWWIDSYFLCRIVCTCTFLLCHDPEQISDKTMTKMNREACFFPSLDSRHVALLLICVTFNFAHLHCIIWPHPLYYGQPGSSLQAKVASARSERSQWWSVISHREEWWPATDYCK